MSRAVFYSVFGAICAVYVALLAWFVYKGWHEQTAWLMFALPAALAGRFFRRRLSRCARCRCRRSRGVGLGGTG
jgi:hypothetical protein